MTNEERIKAWITCVGVAILLLFISNKFTVNPNRTKILVKAPENMVTAFQATFEELKLDKDYIIEMVEDESKANFEVIEGMNKEGKLIAYSPIIAVFNADEEYEKTLIKEGIFVPSEIETEYNDFDFYKVILQAISGKECKFKIYFPGKNSDTWEVFYQFMLFTVNDGCYPSSVEEMAQAKQIVNKFLNSKYAEPFNNSIERTNGISKNSIYFMPYVDLARLYVESGNFSCRVMYPKTVVYHSYYAKYDEIGKVIYDSLDADCKAFGFTSPNVGYAKLRNKGYNTKYNIGALNIGDYVYGNRLYFNGVEIPKIEKNNYKEEP